MIVPTQTEVFHPFVECDVLREAVRPLIKATPQAALHHVNQYVSL